MNIELIALTLDAIGAAFIGYAALRVHYRVLREHKVDKRVFRTMRREQIIGWTGVGMIVAGFLLTLFGKL